MAQKEERVKRDRISGLWLTLTLLVALVFLSSCAPAEDSGQGGISSIYMIVFVLLFIGVLYFLTIRPQRQRQKEHQELMAQLRKGDKVITVAGIYGQIESVDEDSIVLKVESGATIRVTRNSIAAKRQR